MMIGAAPSSVVERAPQLPLTYYASKRKALPSLLGCLVFVAIACWFIIDPSANDLSPQKTRIVSFAGIILFGSGVVASAYMLIWRLRIVTLDETGILIAGHKRWIAWTEITNIELVYQHTPVFYGAGPREIEWIGHPRILCVVGTDWPQIVGNEGAQARHSHTDQLLFASSRTRYVDRLAERISFGIFAIDHRSGSCG